MKEKKHIVVIGLGEFGMELAQQLAKECEVLALDWEAAMVEAILDKVQRALFVDVRDFHALSSVVTRDFDEGIVSMGESLESSILATLHLKKIGVKRIWAKATTEDHAAILKSIGASDVIFPERETARRLAAQLTNPNLLDFIPLEEDYRVMDVAPPDSFYGHTLIGRTKPNPDIYLEALDRLKVSKDEAVVFEDSPHGVLAARRAGIFVGAIPNPMTARMRVTGDLTVSTLAELSLQDLRKRNGRA